MGVFVARLANRLGSALLIKARSVGRSSRYRPAVRGRMMPLTDPCRVLESRVQPLIEQRDQRGCSAPTRQPFGNVAFRVPGRRAMDNRKPERDAGALTSMTFAWGGTRKVKLIAARC